MAELKNPNEAFAQNVMRVLNPAQAYVAAGFQKGWSGGGKCRAFDEN